MPHAEPGDFGPSGGRLVGDQALNLSLTLIVLDAICIGTNKMEITKLFFLGFFFGDFQTISKFTVGMWKHGDITKKKSDGAVRRPQGLNSLDKLILEEKTKAEHAVIRLPRLTDLTAPLPLCSSYSKPW